MEKNKNYKEIVGKMMNLLNIVGNLQKLIEDGKFIVSTNQKTKQLTIKKNTHHKINFNINYEPCVFSTDNCIPAKIAIYYFGEKTDDYIINTNPTMEQSIKLESIGNKYLPDFKSIIIKGD